MNGPAKARTWWHEHNGWVAVLVLTMGAAGFGYGLGVHQRQAELSNAYTQALAAKDKLIDQLARSAAVATGQAADAAVTAANAADVASDAALNAEKAAAATHDRRVQP